MIKKLDVMKDTRNVIDKDGIVHTVANFTAIEKINELVDAVNEIMTWRFETDDDSDSPEHEEPADPYAEQRKWIGKLCRFRHALGASPTYGILGKISTNSDFPYYKKDTDTYWKHCEPVFPTDNAIYKGGDNE